MTFFSSALHIRCEMRSVEEAEDLSTNVLGSGLVVVHDTLVGGKDENTELSGGEDGVAEVLELLEGKIETGGDDTALVEATVEVDNDLAGASIIDDLELVDVAVSLHDLKELNEDLGGGSQDNLNYILMVRTSFIIEKKLSDDKPMQYLSTVTRQSMTIIKGACGSDTKTFYASFA